MPKRVDSHKIKEAAKILEKIRREVSKLIVGQHKVIDSLIMTLLANSHVIVEGVPGIAKTVLIKTLATVTGCQQSRIQFTVDLLPSDITGITSYEPKKGFFILKGPIFANFIIADEINRAPPKTQSALLEAMQERQVTIGRETFKLTEPFFVMATMNPIESSGVYKLPEAQIDRFLFKVNIFYPKQDEEHRILKKNISLESFQSYNIRAVTTPKKIIEMQELAKKIFISKDVERYILEIVNATRHPDKYDIKKGKYIEWGASPRASIGLFIASKTRALMLGNSFVIPQHIKDIAHDVLRHRILLNYEGEAENVTTDNIIDEILSKVPIP